MTYNRTNDPEEIDTVRREIARLEDNFSRIGPELKNNPGIYSLIKYYYDNQIRMLSDRMNPSASPTPTLTPVDPCQIPEFGLVSRMEDSQESWHIEH